jgi:hypothetical protein
MDQQPAPFSQPEPSSWNGYLIAIVICIIVGALYYFISPHYQTIVDYIDTMKSVSEMLYTLASVFYTTDKEPTQEKQPIEPTLEQTAVSNVKSQATAPKEKNITQTPKPDDSTSNIQGLGTAGYCYVGEWKGIRSCVKVDKTTPCKTQKYSTEELCVNPTLRP